MKSVIRRLGTASLGLLMVPLLAVPARAAGIGFRNDHKIPIIVQGASIVNKMLRRGQPLLIQPGKIGWDLNLNPGLRFITVYDGTQPTRILYQTPVNQPIPFQGRDLFFRVSHQPIRGNPFRVLLFPMPPP